ncbi:MULTISPECIES: hypothetical protein, partial [unclassified Brucella]
MVTEAGLMQYGHYFFHEGTLSEYLSRLGLTIQSRVDAVVGPAIFSASNEEIAKSMVADGMIAPLRINFGSAQTTPHAAKVEVSEYGRVIEIDGIQVIRRFTFEGDAGLFELEPNAYSSMKPSGEIAGNAVMIAASGYTDDAKQIKEDLDAKTELLRYYVENQQKQIATFSAELEHRLVQLIAQRKKYMTDIEAARGLSGIL